MEMQRVVCMAAAPLFLGSLVALGGEAGKPAEVKVAAVQMLGYDKTDLPRPGFDPSETVVRYVEKAAQDAAQLVVFPEYLLGRISIPGPETHRISGAAAANHIYVIVGCWEVFRDGTFANTAILFDRAGKILGKYNKVHAAVDHFEGTPPWSRPPEGKNAEWFLRNDPEWAMKKGGDFPVFDLDFGRIGILTCYDGWFPETFRVLSLKGAEVLVWINGRRGAVEDFLVKSAMFQDEVAMVCTNQAYGSGTMIGQWPARILASCPEPKESYLTATINLKQVRSARNNSRNLRQRRPELYGEIVKPKTSASDWRRSAMNKWLRGFAIAPAVLGTGQVLAQQESAVAVKVLCDNDTSENGNDVPKDGTAEMPWVRVADDKHGFVLSQSGPPFVPWGFNYDHDENGRLLEDYWEKEWPKVEEDFGEMKQLGANVVRIHLQFARFMANAEKPNEANLDRLSRLVRLAERTGLYLDITGLACYRKKDVPQWYDRLKEHDRWEAQAHFWEAVAGRCAKSPAIFCYDLMNEPVVPGGARKPGDWLGPSFLGSDSGYFVQFVTLEQQDRPRPVIARQWCHRLVTAIRKQDPRHLITVGLVPWSLDRPGLTSGFVPKEIAPELDFLAVHIYPEKGKVKEAMETLSGFAVGKPVVIEEMFPLKCPLPEFEQFLDESRKHASGWIGFYWGKTAEECRRSNTIRDAVMLRWLEFFQKRAGEARSGGPGHSTSMERRRLPWGTTKSQVATRAFAVDLCGDEREEPVLCQPYPGHLSGRFHSEGCGNDRFAGYAPPNWRDLA